MEILLPIILPRQPAFVMEDDLPNAKNFALEQEEPWIPQMQARPWTAIPFIDDELPVSFANFGKDQEDAPNVQRMSVAWNPSIATDDDAGIFPLTVVDQEDGWNWLLQTVPWQAIRFLDDEIGTSLANFALEQEEPWVAQVQVIPWLPRPVLDDEIWPSWRTVEEEYPWVAAYQSRPWTTTLVLSEEAFASTTFYREQEEFWTTQIQTVVWVPRCFLDDEIYPFGIPLAGDPCKPQRAFLNDAVAQAGFRVDTPVQRSAVSDSPPQRGFGPCCN